MEYKTAKSNIRILARRSRYLVMFAVALLCCNALFALLLWHQSNNRQVVLVPMGLHKTATIAHGEVSAAYLEQCAIFFINERLNVTPKSVAASDELVLAHTSPPYYATFKGQLLQEQKIVLNKKISSAFYLRRIQLDTKHLTVWVTGTLRRWVGERELKSSSKRYRLHFQQHGSEILLSAFQEIKNSRRL